jgi:hypothetical protein
MANKKNDSFLVLKRRTKKLFVKKGNKSIQLASGIDANKKAELLSDKHILLIENK